MGATLFEGDGPVGRYWLSRCEGFEVKGSARGVVEELMRDGDPHVATRIVVRTRGRRRKVVPVTRVTTVDPTLRVLVVERPQRPARPPVWRPRGRRAAAASARWTAASARFQATMARRAYRRSASELGAAVRYARPWLEAGVLVLAGSLRRLAAEARASGAMLLRSVPWRRYGRSARSVSTRLARVRSRRSSRRPTT